MPLKATSTGNAGFLLEAGGKRIYIDSFFRGAGGVGGPPVLRGADAAPAELILLTHAHYDHFHPEETRDAALASGAVVAAPAEAIRVLAKLLPADRLIEFEPAERQKPPATVSKEIAGISVTAFRTYHGRGHNSYLIEFAGCRVFHDGDNERTQPYNLTGLGQLDALLLCPWAGSGAGKFVRALSPGKWLLVHLTPEEIQAHRTGEFLPGLAEPVPEGAIALAGGESVEV